jgi:hypothetical protein
MTQVDLKMTTYIMIFYAVLSYLLGPAIGYNITKTKDGIGYGLVAGSLISIVLWYTYGSKKI